MSNKKQDNLKYNPDLTEHDKDILNQDNVHGDGGDDQQLKDREKDTNFSKSNLDIPKPKPTHNHKELNDKENNIYDGTSN